MQHDKPVFTMMVGLPYSGKSVYAEKLRNNTGAVVHSSDTVREEILGDIQDQTQNAKVFDELHRRVRRDLADGRNVVYDATNINYKRRMHVLQMVGKTQCEKVCVFMATPFADCIERRKHRDRVVPYEVVERMYKSIWIPHRYEGWDRIEIVYPDDCPIRPLSELFYNENSPLNIDQDNPNHTLTVMEHCTKTYETLQAATVRLQWAALLHDIGKPFTKSFVNSKGETTDIAHYYNHQHVSAYESLFYCHWKKPYLPVTLDVAALIQWHMRPFEIAKMPNSALADKKLHDLIGTDLYIELMELHKADRAAH